MSSTLPDTLSPNNPITPAVITSTLTPLGLSVPDEDLETYTSLTQGVWEVWNEVQEMDDYVPEVDERFAREDVHKPTKEENAGNAWAWKATVRDRGENGGLLAGKSVVLKDNIALAGVPCQVGTDAIQDWTPTYDATVVTRILEAGGTIVGKATCENLCYWGASNSANTGPVWNPYAEGYSAGGSSSGTAVLVATGEVDLGVGGDQGGSVRMPAGHCGLVGLKPTFGLIPYTGAVSLEPTLDHLGPMTRNVLDNALLLQVLAGADGLDDRQGAGCPLRANVPAYLEQLHATVATGVKGMRIGVLTEGFTTSRSDPRVNELVKAAIKRFEELGAHVENVSVPFHSKGTLLWSTIGRLSAHATFMGRSAGRRGLAMNDLTRKSVPLTQENFDKLWVTMKGLVIAGEFAWANMPPELLGKATNLVRKLRDDYNAALDRFDVLIMPTNPQLAQRLAAQDRPIMELAKGGSGLTPNTCPFNVTGLPALSFPIGTLRAPDAPVDLPVGAQIVGKAYAEETLYRVAYAWERENDWKTFGK